MSVYHYLASLPAILGIAGFFTYLWVGQSRIGGEMLKRIVEKLRTDPNINIKQYGQLTPAKLRGLVATDERVRNSVNQGDRDLLRLLIILQYLMTGLVLLVCAVMVGVSVWLYTRPEPFSVTQLGPKAVVSDAQGKLIDLDPIEVAWTYGGPEKQLSVFLENLDTGGRTDKKPVPASARSVQLAPADLTPLLKDRSYHGRNRIRSIIEWAGGSSISDAQDLLVGIDVELQLFGRLVTPDGQMRDINTLFAMIDRNTGNMPQNYRFEGDLVARTNSGPLVIPLESDNLNGEVILPALDHVDWAGPLGFVYNGPDSREIVRTTVTGRKPLSRISSTSP